MIPEKVEEWIRGCGPFSDVARKFIDQTLYVPFATFRRNLRYVAREILSSVPLGPFLLLVGDSGLGSGHAKNPEKHSKYWCTALCRDLLKGYDDEFILIESIEDAKLYPTIKTIVIIDDAAYSGRQIHGAFYEIGMSLEVYIAIPYIASQAIHNISSLMYQDNLRVYFNHVVVMPNMGIWLDNPHINEFVMMNSSSAEREKGLVTTYFDHKIADEASSFPSIYCYGRTIPEMPSVPFIVGVPPCIDR